MTIPVARRNFQNPLLRLGAFLFTAGLLLACAPRARADDQKDNTPTLTDKTSETFSKIQPLWDAKNWQGVLDLMDGLLPQIDPNSYDTLLVNYMKAKAIIEEDKITDAVGPLESVLQLADQNPNFVGNGPPFGHDDMSLVLNMLASIYAQEGSDTKDQQLQLQYYDKAIVYFQRFLKASKKPNPDVQANYCTLLMSEAATDPKHINEPLMHRAEDEIQKGLRMSIVPKEQLYVLYAYALTESGELSKAAEYYELMVKLYPKKKEYWSQLFALYNNLAGQQKDEDRARALYARAVNVLLRAQALGFMNTPKDNFNLITIYFQAGQFDQATELLDTGLKDGSVDANDVKNWQLLAFSYQQINQLDKSIAVYKAAQDHFPDDGDLDYNIGLIYFQMDKIKEAHDEFASAVAKSKLERGFDTYRLLAYTAFELGEDKGDIALFQEALKAIDDATDKFPADAGKDSTWKAMRESVADSIKHANFLKARAEQQSQPTS